MIGKRKWCNENSKQNLDVTKNDGNNIDDVNYEDEHPFLMMPRLYLVQQSIDVRNTNLQMDEYNRHTEEHKRHTLEYMSNASNIKPQNKEQGIPEWLELPPTGITEISGEAGTGKTQVGLGLCVACASRSFSKKSDAIRLSNTITGAPSHYASTTVPRNQSKIHPQLKSYYHKSVYISMGGEGTSTSQIAHRLQQMAQVHSVNQTPSGPTTKEILQRIWTRSVSNTEAFQQFLFSELPQLLLKQYRQGGDRFGLLVFDSIAGLYRTKEHGNNDKSDKVGPLEQTPSMYYVQRSQDLFTIASQLKYLSDRFGVGIVVLNQVTATASAVINKGESGTGIDSKLVVVPALGLTWSNCVNHRYILSRVEERVGNSLEEEGNDSDWNTVTRFVRKIRIYSSPRFSTSMEARFRIAECGVSLFQ